MRYEVTTVNYEKIDLGDPIAVRLNKSYDTPADDLYAVFCFENVIAEMKTIKVYQDNQIIFDGILDEQIVEVSTKGNLLKIYARSKAALLVDNEALPQTYTNVSLKTIFDRHIMPYGFTEFLGSNKKFATEFVVYKGMSEWEVLENFCSIFFNTIPRIDSNGVVNTTGTHDGTKNIVLENNETSINYKSLSKNILRYNKISEIFVKSSNNSTYSIKVQNNNAISKGIKRKRYLNATASIKTPANLANQAIDAANKKSSKIIAQCIGMVNTDIGCRVTINNALLGEIKNVYVSKIKYTLDSSGEITELTMYEGD